MQLKVGERLRSAVSEVEIIVVRAPGGTVDLTCGGATMVPLDSAPTGGPIAPGADDPVLIGKRFWDEASGLELLVTKGGVGTLALGGAPLALREAKPLPSSD